MVYKGIWILVASAYGAAGYGGNVYGGAGTLVQVGPLSLPNTGAGWTVLISAGVLAVSGGWGVWLWQRRRLARKAQPVAEARELVV
jgi:LPXTG-motif cell wall-anchored protein